MGKRLGNIVFSGRRLVFAPARHRDDRRVRAGSDGDGNTWIDFTLPDYGSYPLADELDELAELIEYRPGVLGEALAQRNNIVGYFCGLWSFAPGSHPKTSRIVTIAMQIAQFQAMWHKAYWNRPRPSQLYPVLMPPIDGSGACRLSERPRDGGISRREGARGNPAAGCLEPDPGADLAPSADA